MLSEGLRGQKSDELDCYKKIIKVGSYCHYRSSHVIISNYLIHHITACMNSDLKS